MTSRGLSASLTTSFRHSGKPKRPGILAFSLLSSIVKGPIAARVNRRFGEARKPFQKRERKLKSEFPLLQGVVLEEFTEIQKNFRAKMP
jgi:hypothetical protein